MRPMDIYVADVPFDDKDASKLRPALVVKVSNSRVNVFKITTKYKKKSEKIKKFYYPIKEWTEAGLKEQSYVDVHRTYNISQRVVFSRKPIGKLTSLDILALFKFIQNIQKNN